MGNDPLATAKADLLRRAPDSWADVPDNLSQAQRDAAITAAGFVERRSTVTLRLPGDEQAQRITIEATGEFSLAEAMEPTNAPCGVDSQGKRRKAIVGRHAPGGSAMRAHRRGAENVEKPE